ncbi:MAG: 50S ribosomal protein L10 [SAR202 cluster bacterium]|nr:50S ribosomal protein L10 [SAR202 cluster bacterium]
MPTDLKEQKVAELAELFSNSPILITADYSGLPVGQMNEMRRSLQEQGVKFRVIKNSLALLAADASGKTALKEVIEGQTGIAFGGDEPTVPAKALSDFVRRTRSSLKILGAEFEGQALNPQQVSQLATLPSRDELVSQLLARMKSPMSGLVNVLNGPLGGLARVLQQHADNLAQQPAE